MYGNRKCIQDIHLQHYSMHLLVDTYIALAAMMIYHLYTEKSTTIVSQESVRIHEI